MKKTKKLTHCLGLLLLACILLSAQAYAEDYSDGYPPGLGPNDCPHQTIATHTISGKIVALHMDTEFFEFDPYIDIKTQKGVISIHFNLPEDIYKYFTKKPLGKHVSITYDHERAFLRDSCVDSNYFRNGKLLKNSITNK